MTRRPPAARLTFSCLLGLLLLASSPGAAARPEEKGTVTALEKGEVKAAAARLTTPAALQTPSASAPPAPSAPPFAFRAGQAIYIVAYRTVLPTVTADAAASSAGPDYRDSALDVERELRKKIEKWGFFTVVDRPSRADFIFLVNFDDGAAEGLALPLGAYQRHYKDEFDLDALRDAAHGRFLAGPLKLPTVGRLTERLVRQFRERVAP
ncbi:MAG TPA: hypothetical protein VG148_17420 [Pyrinomonadaceae bacterium]|nr:hypothetical protein [Pyrinomonadaceae bacterium]